MYGVDGTFAFFEALTFATSVARSRSEGLEDDDISYRAQMDYGGDRYGLQIERLVVGRNFNPEVGFLRRSDLYKNFALVRFSPRPASIPAVRKFSGTGQITYIEDGAGRVTTRVLDGEFGIELPCRCSRVGASRERSGRSTSACSASRRTRMKPPARCRRTSPSRGSNAICSAGATWARCSKADRRPSRPPASRTAPGASTASSGSTTKSTSSATTRARTRPGLKATTRATGRG